MGRLHTTTFKIIKQDLPLQMWKPAATLRLVKYWSHWKWLWVKYSIIFFFERERKRKTLMKSDLKSSGYFWGRETGPFFSLPFLPFWCLKWNGPLSIQLSWSPCPGCPHPLPNLYEWVLDLEGLENNLSSFFLGEERKTTHCERVSGPRKRLRSLDFCSPSFLHVGFPTTLDFSSDSPGPDLLFSPSAIIRYPVCSEDKKQPCICHPGLSFGQH